MFRQSKRQAAFGGARIDLPDNGEIAPDAASALCSEWLARHCEQEQLTMRCQALETHLFRDHNWCDLSEAQRASLPEAAEFDAMNDQIIALHDFNREQLKAVTDLAATTGPGLVSKLSVALAIVLPDENEDAHALLRSILKDLEAAGIEPGRARG
ncbi:hypothetical protein HNE_0807 [Hyphomonas neptunium ATCC 15444]|uniref:Uncharacterized protein n=2 Tax=Hyphomonas TaxID=85 RepID=Q0C409_HYPNA|nr:MULTISPECIES: hypothetical protein [Hyphomonas]ABI78415.1 hypothetical protein HNE_0807 [Hyphomonas neptunium ATCC 15444]KCZ96253.1 hypothetical protein HHI_01200 [Hyphomonas hirschiana VP5]